MKSITKDFSSVNEAADFLGRLPDGECTVYSSYDSMPFLNEAIFMRMEAMAKMKNPRIVFKRIIPKPGTVLFRTSNNDLIDLDFKTKRSRVLESVSKLKENETAFFPFEEIDPIYLRSLLSKTGVTYTTKATTEGTHVTRAKKHQSASSLIREQIKAIEGTVGRITFDGDVAYLRVIVSSMKTNDFRYSVKRVSESIFEIRRLFTAEAEVENRIKLQDDFYSELNLHKFLTDTERVIFKSLTDKISEGLADEAATPEPAKIERVYVPAPAYVETAEPEAEDVVDHWSNDPESDGVSYGRYPGDEAGHEAEDESEDPDDYDASALNPTSRVFDYGPDIEDGII